MAASDIITLGIGPGGDIETMLTGGLELGVAVSYPPTIYATGWDRYFSTATSEDRYGIAALGSNMVYLVSNGNVIHLTDYADFQLMDRVTTYHATSRDRYFSTATSEDRPDD